MLTTPEPTTTHGLSQDRLLHATLGRYTLGASPAALAQSFQGWLTYLAPG